MVKSDSISALIMTLRLKTDGEGTTTIAQELALDIASGIYRPQITQHVPGLANKTADILSRMHAPNSESVLPEHLGGLTRRRYQLKCSVFKTVDWEKKMDVHN